MLLSRARLCRRHVRNAALRLSELLNFGSAFPPFFLCGPCAAAWQRSGWVRGYAGDADGTIESLNKAIRLNPLPRVFLTHSAMAFAHFTAAATTKRHAGRRRLSASSRTGCLRSA